MVKRTQKFIIISVSLIILTITSLLIVNWWEGMHYIDFRLGENYEVELVADECTSCFLDWQIWYDIEITNLNTGKEITFQFETIEGPRMLFMLSEKEPHLILIKGLEGNEGASWLINLEEGTINDSFYGQSDRFENFMPVAELNQLFEIEYSP